MRQDITAYFDESATQAIGSGPLPREKRAVIVAGFYARAEQWERLEEDWNRIFEQHGLGGQTVLHMTELTPSIGHFQVFKDDPWTKARFISQLIGLLRLRVLGSIGRSLRLHDYDELDKELTLHEKATPYTFCGMAAVEQATKSANRLNGKLKVIFEYGFPGAGQLVGLCRRDGFPLPSFAQKKEWRALQAADLLAWESQKAWKRVLRQEGTGVRKSLRELARGHNSWRDYTRDNLLAAVRHIGCEAREDLQASQ